MSTPAFSTSGSQLPSGRLTQTLASQTAAAQSLQSTKPNLTSKRIQDLVASVAGPDERLDPEVEALLLELADDFVEDVANYACMLAKHRNSTTLDVQDLQLHLEKHWRMRLPGFSTPTAALPSSAVPSFGPSVPSTLADSTQRHIKNILTPSYGIGEAHRKRMALIAKAKQKEAKRAANATTTSAGGETSTATTTAAASSTALTNGSDATSTQQAKKRKRPTEE